jgi:translation initiation factor IF-1
MPKNRFGGKNAKKMGNKHVSDYADNRLVLPECDDQYVARVTKRCGDGRFLVEFMDESKGKVEAIARIPGSLRRSSRNVRDGSYVLYQKWGLNDNDNKGSILHLYSDHEIIMLNHSGALEGLNEHTTQDSNVIIASVSTAATETKTESATGDELLDWDAI